ncbi:hypothetical protein Y032_0037g3501 [Ancylostoma ceylanicum]|uniref:Uncharacterized protein n=1 Tax=Ancylostoma ceylanicum TaxID=53326 RepID=A0A016UKM0_9BILA|nr:hypothetical protein Y032_0037g3501 [Ancylostoma ceylanicum]
MDVLWRSPLYPIAQCLFRLFAVGVAVTSALRRISCMFHRSLWPLHVPPPEASLPRDSAPPPGAPPRVDGSNCDARVSGRLGTQSAVAVVRQRLGQVLHSHLACSVPSPPPSLVVSIATQVSVSFCRRLCLLRLISARAFLMEGTGFG